VGAVWNFNLEMVERKGYIFPTNFLIESGFLGLIHTELTAIIPGHVCH
jgi:hypothetical protein